MMMSFFGIPQLDDMFKIYVVAIVTFITMLMNVLFRFRQIREWVINRLVVDVRERLFQDSDFRKTFNEKLQEQNKK
jgi:hypothetical protein